LLTHEMVFFIYVLVRMAKCFRSKCKKPRRNPARLLISWVT